MWCCTFRWVPAPWGTGARGPRAGCIVHQDSRPASERPVWGWTTPAMLFTHSRFLSETGRNQPSANVAAAQVGVIGDLQYAAVSEVR
jgi:hypothetical protein